jgi:hypothetical protein
MNDRYIFYIIRLYKLSNLMRYRVNFKHHKRDYVEILNVYYASEFHPKLEVFNIL